MKICMVIITFCLLSSQTHAKETIETHITKSANEVWSVIYQITAPVKKLGFMRNADNSRQQRWTPSSDDFQIIFEDGQEYISRIDGKGFTKVKFYLQPTYVSLLKGYAPFSPFSDGGMLFHSGRIFVCAEKCTDADNEWKFSLSVPFSDHIILKGHIKRRKVDWLAKGDGQNIYVGKQLPVNTDQLIAVVDAALPKKLKSSLNLTFPNMMRYFEKYFGRLPHKPMLFASYGKTRGNPYGSQGGTLPDQVFMHWYGNKLNGLVKDERYINDMMWFYAHEAGHLYQKDKGSEDNNKQAWIHEGHADKLAAMALIAVFPELKSYVKERFDNARDKCFAGLKEMPLSEASSRGRFDLHYYCGLIIHDAIDRFMRDADPQSDGAVTMWIKYQEGLARKPSARLETFLAVLGELTSGEFAQSIFRFINEKHDRPERIYVDNTGNTATRKITPLKSWNRECLTASVLIKKICN